MPWRIEGVLQAAVSTLAALIADEGMVRAELERIEAPTMVVWGVQDRMIPRRLVDELLELHPSWEFRTVDSIGHLLPLEAPQMYVDLVADWMASRTEPALGCAAPSDDALDR